MNVISLQRFQGKCISFSLAVPATKLFIRAISSAIGSVKPSGMVILTPLLRQDLEYWRFLDSWEDVLPWRHHYRLGIKFFDTSGVLARGV